MHPLLRLPYAALGAAAEAVAAIAGVPGHDAPKWRRALGARNGLRARLAAFAEMRDASRPLVWFHAPSAGEALQALPVHARIRGQTGMEDAAGTLASPRNPVQTALTIFSPSAENVAKKFHADFCDYLPFDTAKGANAALAALRPSALVYSKLDVWPMLTARAKAADVPVGLISATLRRNSSRHGSLAGALLRDAYASLDLVGAISELSARRLVQLGVREDRIRITGDTRYDQVSERASKVELNSSLLAPLASARPTLVAGSTWTADVHVLFDAWAAVRKKFPDARLIIAPHEPTAEHIARIDAHAEAQRLSSRKLSQGTGADADVVVVDRVGILGEIYALGWAAFVGGGFHRAGLHSVLEPAAFGIPVVAGGLADENEDFERLIAAEGARRVVTPQALANTVIEMFVDHESAGKMGAAAKAVIVANLGAADRAAELVRGLWSTT